MMQENRNESDTTELSRQDVSTADLAGRTEPQNTSQVAEERPRERGDEGSEPLFPADDGKALRDRWQSIQAGFVDEPRKAVEDADHLVASTIKRLAEIFAGERERLEGQWDRGDDVSTEDLRVALRRYRSFFDRLLSM